MILFHNSFYLYWTLSFSAMSALEDKSINLKFPEPNSISLEVSPKENSKTVTFRIIVVLKKVFCLLTLKW